MSSPAPNSNEQTPDPKKGEREYYARKGPEAVAHSLNKPFSDEQCGFNLANLAALFHLLPPPPSRVLHLGCGVGWLTRMLALRGYEVTGVDIAPEAITAATERGQADRLDNISFVTADYEDLSYEAEFDVVLFYDALHHAEDAALALQQARKSLQPGGVLIAFEPGEGHQDTETSRHAVETFGVHENDMPPARIIELGKAVGFDRHLVLPHPAALMQELYDPEYGQAADAEEAKRKLLDHSWQLSRELLRGDSGRAFVLLWA